VCRWRFWQDYFALRPATKDDPWRFPRRRPLLEALESRLAPQSIAAAAAPFALVGLLATETLPDEVASAAAVPPRDEKELTDLASAATLDSLWTAWQHEGEAVRGDALALAHTEQPLVLGEHKSVEKKDSDADDKESDTTSAAQRSGHRPQDRPDGHNLAGATGGGGGGSDAHTPEMRQSPRGGDGGSSASSAPPDGSGLTSFLDGGGQGGANGIAAANPTAQASSGSSPTSAAGAAPAVSPNSPPASPTATPSTTTTPAPQAFVQSDYAKAPLAFTPNVGQTDSSVQFVTQHAGFTGFVGQGGQVTFEFPLPSDATTGSTGGADVFRMSLVGANPNAAVSTGTLLPSTTNYYLGDPSQWYADVPNYASVTYRDVYPGIDMMLRADTAGHFSYDFLAQPGADLSQIKVAWQGPASTSLDANGNLLLSGTSGPAIVQSAPAAYQVPSSGVKSAVTVQQVLDTSGNLTFNVSGYDPSQPLVIDPSISYATYLGGSGTDTGNAIAVSPTGAAWITGSTTSATTFPGTVGTFGSLGGTDVFVTKLNSTGSVAWTALLGGSGTNVANAIAVDPAGDSYFAGTAVTGYPVENPLSGQSFSSSSTGFVSALNATGDGLMFSSPLGPAGTGLTGIAVDSSGAVYVTGYTPSSAYPLLHPFQGTYGGGSDDGVITKINPAAAALIYSSFLGGSANDSGNAVAVDAAGDAFIGGYTQSPNFRTTAGAYKTSLPYSGGSGFVAKVNADGSLSYSTFIGGTNGSDSVHGLTLDSSGDAFLTGTANSTNYPTTTGAYSTSSSGGAFVTELNSTGSALVYSGVIASATGAAIALDSSGNAWATGTTTGSFPVTSNAYQSTYGGSTDSYFLEVNSTGTTISYGCAILGNTCRFSLLNV
jgi:hypothetical protein